MRFLARLRFIGGASATCSIENSSFPVVGLMNVVLWMVFSIFMYRSPFLHVSVSSGLLFIVVLLLFAFSIEFDSIDFLYVSEAVFQ